MEPQVPPEKRPYKNGIAHGRGRATFAPRSWSFLWRAKLEGAVVIGVIAGVVAVFIFLLQIPGALIVRVMDDKRMPVPKARAHCRHAGTGLEMVGITDVFGETKFPGLERGIWSCEVQPPDRFFSPLLIGTAKVWPRNPAVVELLATRGVEVEVSVARPQGAPRASPAIRAVCEPKAGQPAQGWEARAGLLDGTALLYLPRDSSCRLGLVPGARGFVNGPPESTELACDSLPCEAISGQPGARLAVKLTPSREQWDAARPPPEPDEAADAGPAATGADGGR